MEFLFWFTADRRGDFVKKMGEAQDFSPEVKKALRAIGGDYETFLRTLDSVFEANKSIRNQYSLHTETDFSIASKVIQNKIHFDTFILIIVVKNLREMFKDN